MTPNEVNRHTLSNGLRLVHSEDTSTPNVALDILYDVGSRDENPSLTGMAHLFEHLMFGGSPNVPFFDTELEIAGGWSNAWTSSDFTNFYDVLPAVNVQTAFWIESDRMKGLSFSDKALEVQKKVVVEEFKQTSLNRPYGDTAHHLHSLLYHNHPYRWPVIGLDPSHIEKVTEMDVRQFFYRHYGPDNAVLAITGNISFNRAVGLTERWFSEIPPISPSQRMLASEPSIASPRYKEITGKVPYPRLTIAFLMAGRDSFNDLEYEAADILTDILASGRSSRFYRNLIIPGYLAFADASIYGSRDVGYMMITGQCENNSESAIREAECCLWHELDNVLQYGVTCDELDRAVNKYITRMEYNNIGFLSKAQSLAMDEMLGLDSRMLIRRYRSLTPEIVNEIARRIIHKEKSATLVYRPV